MEDPPWLADALARFRTESAAAGLPPTVEDPATIARVASILGPERRRTGPTTKAALKSGRHRRTVIQIT